MTHRDELLAAARRLIEQRGYAHITARDLVAESGTNLASIGYHFGSKAGLLNAAIEASFDDWAGQLAAFVMSDPDASPLQRAGATWVAVLERMPQRRPIIQSYVEALAEAMRVPQLRDQLAAHYRRARSMVAELVALSLGPGTDVTDPRCTAVAALVIAACDGLAMQWLLDAEHMPDADDLAAGLAAVVAASLPDVPDGASEADAAQVLPEISRTAGRTSAR